MTSNGPNLPESTQRERHGWFGDEGSALYRLVLVAVPALCAALAIALLPFGMPMAGYWTDTLDLATTGVIAQRFTPAGYPLTMALGAHLFWAHPVFGFEFEQALLHVGLAVALWAVMRGLGADPRTALIGALLLQLDPELLGSVTKVWDVAFSTLLLLLLMVCALRLLQRGLTWHGVLLVGGVWAFGCFDRPNYVALLPVLLLVLWFASSTGSSGRSAGSLYKLQALLPQVAALVLTAGIVYSASSLVAWHTLTTPGNGPYNLYAGNNPFTRQALLEHLNAEPSILPSLQAVGVDLSHRAPDAASLKPYYSLSSRQFALHQPAAEAGLVLVKLWTMLRPDTKVHPLDSFPGMGKAVLALFVPAWVGMLLLCRMRGLPWTREDTAILLTAILYMVPFLLTNADPRFRTPLDLLVATHVAGLGARLSRWSNVAGRGHDAMR